MKRLIGLLAALSLTPPAASASRAWTSVATALPAGGYVIGNPNARVKLVEYVSYTCPHCAHFVEQSGDQLKALVRSGSISIEVRNQVHDKLDLIAAMIARCAGPTTFPILHEALYTKQGEWVPRGADFDQANAQRMALYPDLDRLKALADGAGLSDIARAAGVSDTQLTQCFAGPATLNAALAASQAIPAQVTGTPTFAINGKLVGPADWAKLKPLLTAAGAK